MNIVLIIKSAEEVAGFISCLYHFINTCICGNCWWLVLSVGEVLCQQQPSAAVVFPVLGEFWEWTEVWLGCQCVRDRRGAPWTHGQSGQTQSQTLPHQSYASRRDVRGLYNFVMSEFLASFPSAPGSAFELVNSAFGSPEQGLYCCEWLKLNCYTEGILFIGCFILSFLMRWKSALPLLITIKSSCVSQSTWILYPGFFILAGCSVMAWAICEAGSDKVHCLAEHSGKQVHVFLILKGCTSSSVVRMRHVEIKSGDISCRTEDFLPRAGKIETSYSRRWTRSCLNSRRKLSFLSVLCLLIIILEGSQPSEQKQLCCRYETI